MRFLRLLAAQKVLFPALISMRSRALSRSCPHSSHSAESLAACYHSHTLRLRGEKNGMRRSLWKLLVRWLFFHQVRILSFRTPVAKCIWLSFHLTRVYLIIRPPISQSSSALFRLHRGRLFPSGTQLWYRPNFTFKPFLLSFFLWTRFRDLTLCGMRI